MRKLTAGLFCSVDGVVEDPFLWQFDSFDEELGAGMGEMMGRIDTALLGRVGYQQWAEYWPNAESDADFAGFINPLPKFVASRTLTGRAGVAEFAPDRGPAGGLRCGPEEQRRRRNRDLQQHLAGPPTAVRRAARHLDADRPSRDRGQRAAAVQRRRSPHPAGAAVVPADQQRQHDSQLRPPRDD